MFGSTSKQPAIDHRIQSALDELEIRYELTDAGAFRVGFELENGRSQTAFIDSYTCEFLGIQVRRISSIALTSQGPFDARTANILLTQNHQFKIGAWEVAVDEEDVHYAFFAVRVEANLPAEELRGVLMTTLITADEMEARLSGRDEF